MAFALVVACTVANPSAGISWENWNIYCYEDSCVAVLRAESDSRIPDRMIMCDETGCYCIGAGPKYKCYRRVPFTPCGIKEAFIHGCCDAF